MGTSIVGIKRGKWIFVSILLGTGFAASHAAAATVDFKVVSGVFDSTDASSATYVSADKSASSTISFAANPSDIMFTNVNDGDILSVGGLNSFGLFTVIGSGNRDIVNVADNFTLTIQVSDPTSAVGPATGTVSGSLRRISGNDVVIDLNDVQLPGDPGLLPYLQFSFNTVTLSEIPLLGDIRTLNGSVEYFANGGGSSDPASGPVDSRAVPLPPAIWSGLSVLAAIGVGTKLRKYRLSRG